MCVCVRACVRVHPASCVLPVQRVLSGFLELLSGWSEGGLEVTPSMLHTIAVHAQAGHNRHALVQLVSPS